MTRTYTIAHAGLTCRVTAVRYPGFAGTREDPPEPESAEIKSVVFNGIDIADDLTDDHLTALEAAWLEAWHDEARAHIDDHD